MPRDFPIVSDGSTLTVRFISDDTIQYAGWELNVQARRPEEDGILHHYFVHFLPMYVVTVEYLKQKEKNIFLKHLDLHK